MFIPPGSKQNASWRHGEPSDFAICFNFATLASANLNRPASTFEPGAADSLNCR
jgi:hypothetical protein